MSTLASPVDSPIMITRSKDYFYVAPASAGLVSITGTGTNFTVTSLNLGRSPTLQIKYTGTIPSGPEYHNLALTATFNDGSTVSQTLVFIIFNDGGVVIPNITNPSAVHVATVASVNFSVITSPTGTGTLSAEDLPGWLSVSSGVVSGTSPGTGSRTNIKLTVFFIDPVTGGSRTYKRYLQVVVGDGGDGGGGGAILIPPPPAVENAYFDGDYNDAQIAGPPVYEIPFKTDPKRYSYRVPYWRFDQNYVPLAYNDLGPFGGYYVGESSLKSIGGGVLEFNREFAIVPDTRNEYESFVYSVQMVRADPAGVAEIPCVMQSRIQFDYFKSDDPQNEIELPKAPKAIQVFDTIILAYGWATISVGQEILCQDATMKCWKGNIYERIQRLITVPEYWLAP